MALRYENIPSFGFTKRISELIYDIDAALDSCTDDGDKTIRSVLRKNTFAASVQSSTAIEGNTLGLQKIKETI